MLIFNRDLVRNMNVYDMLCRIQKSVNEGNKCVLYGITHQERKCHPDGCDECIQNWMNEKKS
jgi:hypothetical protein